MGKKRLGRLFGVFRKVVWKGWSDWSVWSRRELCGGTWKGTLRGVALVQVPKWGIENRAIRSLKL